MFTGCQLPFSLSKSDLHGGVSDVHVRTVTLLDGSELDCRTDSLGYSLVKDSVLVWRDGKGNQRLIPVDSIAHGGSTRYPTKAESAVRTLVVGASVATVIFMLSRHRIVVVE
jgi:hypothetical protein